jgi:chromosome segregation ATPase
MSNFEELAGELTATVQELRTKRERLRREIEEDEAECERIDSELDILGERRKEIDGSVRQFKSEREELFTVITETEETKRKIIESLKFLGANLKKFRPPERH